MVLPVPIKVRGIILPPLDYQRLRSGQAVTQAVDLGGRPVGSAGALALSEGGASAIAAIAVRELFL